MKTSSTLLRQTASFTIAILSAAFLGGNVLAAPLTVHLTGGFTNQGFIIDYGDGTYDDITVSATVDLVFTPSQPSCNTTNFTSTSGQVTGTVHIWGNATYYDPFPSLVNDFDNTYGYTSVPISLPISYEGQTGAGGVQDLYWQITSTRDHDKAIPYRLHYYGGSHLLRLWISLPYPFWYSQNDEYYDCTGTASVSGQESVNSCLHGVVTNAATGQPIAGASVRFGNVPQTADNNGAFMYQNIPANTYQLIVASPGYDSVTNLLAIPAFSIVQTNIPLQPVKVPVILVHGWRPDKRTWVWDELIASLNSHQIPYRQVFLEDDGKHPDGSLSPELYVGKVAAAFDFYRHSGYTGKVDVVCHSMGAMVTRLAMEQQSGYGSRVRQWIGIAPVNQGAALADYPGLLPLKVLSWLASVGYKDVRSDGAITGMRIEGAPAKTLASLPRSPGVIYRVIAGYNPCTNDDLACRTNLSPDFKNPHLGPGKTVARLVDNRGVVHTHAWTHYGDSVVALAQSKLPGASSMDCYPWLGHTSLPRDSAVVARVVNYLLNTNFPPLNNCPSDDELWRDADVYAVAAQNNYGTIFTAQQHIENVPIGTDASKLSVRLDYPGSQLALTLFTPSGTQIVPGSYPVLEYSNALGTVWYVIDSPAAGIWRAQVDAIDVPTNGEPYSLVVFVSSPVELLVGSTNEGQPVSPGQSVLLWANLRNGTNAVTGASVSAQSSTPNSQTNYAQFYDDGTHGDLVPNDGIYSVAMAFTNLGKYVLTITASSGQLQRVEVLQIEVQPPPAAPVLAARSVGAGVQLEWAARVGAFLLEGNTNIANAGWSAEDIVPDIGSNYIHTVIVPANGQRYFRLKGSQ